MNDCLNQPALFVGDVDDVVDLDSPPISGEDYIKRVVIEAKRCDRVTVAEIVDLRLKKPTIDVRPLAGCVQAPKSLGPSLDWQQCQIADFSKVRLRIAGLRNEIKKTNRKFENPSITLPDMNDQSSWLDFCSNFMNDDSPVCPPTLDIIFSMSHPTVEGLLEYLVEAIEKRSKIESDIGQWVYALLAALELPLNPDACSCLRTLARTCSIIRANTTAANEHEVNALNLFICLVARYFRQLDLADP